MFAKIGLNEIRQINWPRFRRKLAHTGLSMFDRMFLGLGVLPVPPLSGEEEPRPDEGWTLEDDVVGWVLLIMVGIMFTVLVSFIGWMTWDTFVTGRR